jgi:hypothetical protein
MTKHVSLEDIVLLGINHDRDWTMVRFGHPFKSFPMFSRSEAELLENIITGRYHKYGRSFWFEFEQDAIMFKLKFG